MSEDKIFDIFQIFSRKFNFFQFFSVFLFPLRLCKMHFGAKIVTLVAKQVQSAK